MTSCNMLQAVLYLVLSSKEIKAEINLRFLYDEKYFLAVLKFHVIRIKELGLL